MVARPVRHPLHRAWAPVLCALLLGILLAMTNAAAAQPPRPNPPSAATQPGFTQPGGPEVPPGVTAGIAVFDRETGSFTEQLNVDRRFRSASLVKLLIVLDYLWDRGPEYQVPPDDRARLDAMLRSSDDDAASHFWVEGGYEAVVERMRARLALPNTVPPPPDLRGYWGYTATTAADTVAVYRYLLDSAPDPVRNYILGNLHRATRCAADGFDQFFGIASAFGGPWALKQGWSGFTGGACRPAAGVSQVDLVSEALHTTGTVGAGDRTIIAVLTLHPDGTSYGAAYSAVTRLVRSLSVPGAAPLPGTPFGTWGSGVRVRAAATTDSAVLATLPAGVEVLVSCQQPGQEVIVPPYTNDWWAYLPAYDGYMTNIYIRSPENKLPGVPDCA